MRRIRYMVRKEFLQLVRNRQNFRLLLMAPLFQLLIFGYAVRLDVQDVLTVVVDMDRTGLSRDIVDSFSRSGYFRIVGNLSSYDEADRYLERGWATIAILIPPDLERRIKGERTAEVGIRIDGVDTTTASTVSGYADAILKGFSAERLEARIARARGIRYQRNQPDVVTQQLSVATRSWFNPNLESKDYFVPGIFALILTFFTITVTSMAVVREKERGTIEQLMVTPLSPLELVLGKTLPCFMVALANLVTITFLGLFWFEPVVRGSIPFFLGVGVIYVLTCLAIGMTISTFCSTQQQAMLSSFMVLQPAVLLSGFVFPIHNMPPIIQYVTFINPLRYFIVVVREIFLKGLGWDVLWPQVVPIMVMSVVFILVATMLFRKQVD
ncbi:MAG: ABC transporter permease [Thermodesulfobacteriota bacterium]